MKSINSIPWRRFMSGPAPLLAVIGMAAFVRFFDVDLTGLWYDTASSIATASNDSFASVLRAVKAEMQFPLYFLTLHLWLRLSDNEAWVRSLSVIFGLAAVAMVYLVGKDFFSRRVGLLAAAISAVSSYQIYYSRYPRSYAMFAFFTLVSIYFLRRAFVTGQLRSWVGYALATIIATYTHPYTFTLVLAQWLFAIIYIPLKNRQAAVPWLASQLALAIALIPWLPTMHAYYQVKEVDSWIPAVKLRHLVQLYDKLWFHTKGDYSQWLDRGFYWSRTFLGALILGGLASRSQWREKGILALAVLVPVAFVYFASILFQSIWVARYFVFIAGPFSILAAYSLWKMWEGYGHMGKGIFILSLGLIAALSALPLVSLFRDDAFRNPDVRGAAAWIRPQYRQDDAIVHTNYQSYLPSVWYNRRAAIAKGLPLRERTLCAWKSMPSEWCSAAPYHETQIALNKSNSPDLKRARRLWLVIMYSHRNQLRAPQELANLLRLAEANILGSCRQQLRQDFRGVTVLLCDKSIAEKAQAP